ncbi:MAG: DEAD/DEAH box helicase [Planctomycetota bacterium]
MNPSDDAVEPTPPGQEQAAEEAPSFSFDDLPPSLRETVKRLGWTVPLPVQAKSIPLLLQRKDVVVQSRTGSGKTGAFLLPMCHRIEMDRETVQGLVLVPTRELAEQVYTVLKDLTEGTGIRSVAVYGGVGYKNQLDAFKDKVHIIVATPGRIIDHLTSNRVSLGKLRFLVFDEADEMLSMGFYKSIIKILSFLPDKRQTALFSATIPPGVATLATRFTRDPVHLSLSGDLIHVEEVDHVYYVVDAMYKDRALLKIIEMTNPTEALIFCNTKREVEYLGVFMQNFGYDSDFLSGDLSQKEREKVLRRLRKGQLRFCVATDVMARGIDISELGTVVLYSLPQAHDHYIHRAGRTGRAGSGGVAISLVTPLEECELERRARHFNLNLVKKDLPTDEEVEKRVTERLTVMLEEKYRSISNLEKERLARFLPLAGMLAENGESLEVVAMLFDRFYQETLHKPLYTREEAPAQPESRETQERSQERRDERNNRPRRNDRNRKRNDNSQRRRRR